MPRDAKNAQSGDGRIAGACNQVGDAARQLLDWIGDSGDVLSAERVALLHEAWHAEASARALARALDERPCAAIVGPSRSGKTQLVSSLLDPHSASPSIRFDGIREHVNFLRHVAPDSARHGSAMVMRMAGDRQPGADNFPVSVRLLTIAEIVKILGAAYITGSDRRTVEDEATRLDALVRAAEARLRPEPVAGLGEEDVWDIRHYFAGRFGEEPIMRRLLTSGYWERISGLVARLTNADRAELLGVLWGGLAPFTGAFVAMAEAIAGLGCATEARLALDAVLGIDPRNGKFQRRADNILTAQALGALGRFDDQTVVARSQHGQWVSIARSVLAGIVAEVRLPVGGSDSPLLEAADIIEFPSIDSRTGATSVRDLLERDPAQLGAVFMRAKAHYLLERYVHEQAITAMIVCIDPATVKVGALAGLVGSWVERSHGADPEAREAQANGLFVCFTKLDKELSDPGRRGKDRRVDLARRIEETLVEGFGRGHGWPLAWTTSRAFDNVHLIRSPAARAKQLFAVGSDGRETGLKPDQAERLERARREFAQSEIARRHVADPTVAWNEALEANDGGLAYLAQSVAEVCSRRVKRRHVLADLALVGRGLRSRLERFHVPADAELEQDRRKLAAIAVTRRLRRCAEERRLGHLIRALQPSDAELGDVLVRAGAPPASAPPPAPEGARRPARITRINGHKSAQANGARVLAAVESAAAADAGDGAAAWSRHFAGALMHHWVACARILPRIERMTAELGMPRPTLLALVDELISGARRLEIEDRMAREIEAVIADVDDPEHRMARAAMVGTRVLGDYVMWLGFNDVQSNAHPRRKGRSETPIFPPRKSTGLWSLEADEPEFDRAFFSDWAQAFVALVEANAQDLERGPLDEERNRRLGELLSQLVVTL